MKRRLHFLGMTALFVLTCAAQAELPREGTARGEVIVVGEDRVVIAKPEGGQMTLEAGWKKVGNKWIRNPEQIEYFQTFKRGDKVVATWKLDEGTHFCVQRIEKLGADAPQARREHAAGDHDTPREVANTAQQLHALKDEVAQLRQEIAELRELVKKALEAK